MINIDGSFFENPTFPTITNEQIRENNTNYMSISNNLFDFNKVLKSNIGRKINLNSNDNKQISGIIENVGNDYIIISEPSSGKWYIIKLKDLSYMEFEEKINL